MRVDNRTNARFIMREYIGLGVTLVSCNWLFHAWQSGGLAGYVFAPLAVLGVAVMAAFQHRLSGLAHDASHYTLFRNKLANELVSDLFLMFPIVAMTQKYRLAHFGHHRFVNDPNHDPDLIRLNHPHPREFPVSKRKFWRDYVLLGLWPPVMLRYLFGRAKAANLGTSNGDKPLRNAYNMAVARRMRGAYWLALLAMVHAFNAWPVFWLFWVVPLLTFYPFYMLLREVAHHANAPDDGDFTNSRVFRVHPLLEAAVFPYGQAFHLTHHLFAMVPHYRIAQAHEILLGFPEYRDTITVCNGYFFRNLRREGPSVLDVLRAGHQPGRGSRWDNGHDVVEKPRRSRWFSSTTSRTISIPQARKRRGNSAAVPDECS